MSDENENESWEEHENPQEQEYLNLTTPLKKTSYYCYSSVALI